MQIDGYSLDAQKSRMKAFCEFNDYEIAGEYEDAGKSGKSIEGRVALEDYTGRCRWYRNRFELKRNAINHNAKNQIDRIAG